MSGETFKVPLENTKAVPEMIATACVGFLVLGGRRDEEEDFFLAQTGT